MSETRKHRALLPTLLIILGWALLGYNVFILLGGDKLLFTENFAEHARRTFSAHLLHSAMLAFAAVALILVAYLHFKQGYSQAALTAGAIAVVLGFTIVYPVIAPASVPDETAKNSANELAPSEVYEEGLVSGIVFSDDRPAAVVGTQVLYEGDVKNGVTVVKITKEEVQFEKDGKLWTQRVQSPPSKHWR